jgi:hypothetical protein
MFNSYHFNQDLSKWVLPKVDDPELEGSGNRNMFGWRFDPKFKPGVEPVYRDRTRIEELAAQHQLSRWAKEAIFRFKGYESDEEEDRSENVMTVGGEKTATVTTATNLCKSGYFDFHGQKCPCGPDSEDV